MDNFIDKLAQKFIAGEVIKANSAAEERELKNLREQVAEYEKCLQEMRKIQMTNTQTAQQLHDLMVESSESIHKLTSESNEFFQKLASESTEAFQKLTSGSTEAFEKLTSESAETFERFTSESTEAFQKLTSESTDSYRKLTEESLAKIAGIQLETEVQKAEAKKIVETAGAAMEQMEAKVVKMQETVANLTESLEKNQKEISDWFKQADDFLHKENVKVYRNVQAVIVDEVGNKADAIMKAQEEAVKKYIKPVSIFAIAGFAAAAVSLVVQILEVMGLLGF